MTFDFAFNKIINELDVVSPIFTFLGTALKLSKHISSLCISLDKDKITC
jgi:hypothetical protein